MPIRYKVPFSAHYNWFSIGFTLAILIIITFLVVKKYKPVSSLKSECRLVEKKYLSNKTMVYILEYQNQRFLVADNQQSVALHPLNPENKYVRH